MRRRGATPAGPQPFRRRASSSSSSSSSSSRLVGWSSLAGCRRGAGGWCAFGWSCGRRSAGPTCARWAGMPPTSPRERWWCRWEHRQAVAWVAIQGGGSGGGRGGWAACSTLLVGRPTVQQHAGAPGPARHCVPPDPPGTQTTPPTTCLPRTQPLLDAGPSPGTPRADDPPTTTCLTPTHTLPPLPPTLPGLWLRRAPTFWWRWLRRGWAAPP